MTLIEVLAAIAILGVILVGVVLAKARHTRQIALSARVRAAALAADELIAGWWTAPGGYPVGRSGSVAGDDRLIWRVGLVENAEIENLGGRAVRVEIFDAGPDAESNHGGGDEALAAVELALPATGVDGHNASRAH